MGLLQLLHNEEEWTAYRQRLMTVQQTMGLGMRLPTGPSEYPCLAAGLSQPECVVCCFIYLQDATALLAASASGGASAPSDDLRKIGDAIEMISKSQQRETEAQRDFAKSVNALLLTLVYYVVESGLTRRDKFEEKYVAMLASVDQAYEEDKAHAAIMLDRVRRGN